MRFLRILKVLVLAGITPALAQDSAGPLVKIRLLAERGQISQSEEMLIGIEQSITPGWHTYWKNPGDSGTAPHITWNLPAGFEWYD